ncbi:MAG: hypothetical protein IJ713_01655 [Oscillibacter sp.]|nr:hypothetical protein [Oscillibacter sp.]
MILYINACVRSESRTNRIAKALLETLGGAYEEVKLAEVIPEPLYEQHPGNGAYQSEDAGCG